MKEYIETRVIAEANYILETGSTVRQTAAKFKISKSSVHKDISARLSELDPALARKVGEVMNRNLQERHIRGGRATKLKYKNARRNNTKFSE